MYGIAFVFLVSISNVLCDFPVNPIVTISNGVLLGRHVDYLDNKTYYAFQGIPYAKPPIGDLRFKAPEEVDDWDGILDVGINKNIACVQSDLNEMYDGETEDCLIVNVYTPKLPTEKENKSLLPVMFYIYGGGFVGGSSWYDFNLPDRLIDQDVVVVTVNYRVGPFGFLSTNDLVLPGNYGLKDQQLALKWTQKNIEKFGGDASKVTIFGQSAGGASVGYQILSPRSKGLFRAAIQESGSPICPWAFQRYAQDYAKETASKIDENSVKNNTTSQELFDFLQAQSTVDIKRAAGAICSSEGPSNIQILQGFYYAPVVEPEHDGAFITENMYEMFENGNFSTVPTILGITSEEMVYQAYNSEWFNSISKAWDENPNFLVPDDLHVTEKGQRTNIGKVIKKIYVQNETLEQNVEKAVRYWSDFGFNVALIKQAELARNYTDLYFYQFSYCGDGKCGHGSEYGYIFGGADISGSSPEDQLTSRRIIKLWTNFAKYLNPTPDPEDGVLENIEWETVDNTEEGFVYLNFASSLSMVHGPKEDTYRRWTRVHTDYGVRPFETY